MEALVLAADAAAAKIVSARVLLHTQQVCVFGLFFFTVSPGVRPLLHSTIPKSCFCAFLGKNQLLSPAVRFLHGSLSNVQYTVLAFAWLRVLAVLPST